MTLALATPAVLWLMPLAALPFLVRAERAIHYPSLDAVAPDVASSALDWGLKAAGLLAILALILGLGGLRSEGQTIERLGTGTHAVLVIDRSSSMDDTFGGGAQIPERVRLQPRA